jgi:glycosyltransferase involved in cell wall biosynthesis
MKTYAVLHHPAGFSRRSGMYPLAEAVGATPIFYEFGWARWQRRSWTLGHLLRRLGQWTSGSAWNGWIPVIDEFRIRSKVEPGSLVHFLWADFGSPQWLAAWRRKRTTLVGTFHASARRLPVVLERFRNFERYAQITLMSRTQLPFFAERGYPAERLQVILHGVDTGFFSPGERPAREPGAPLRGLLVGSTERDHEFLARVLNKLPAGVLTLQVLTAPEQQVHYRGVPGAQLHPPVDDEGLLALYRAADLLVMPMLDCAANNVVLEAMACGTPVLTNRIGGIPEYVDAASSFVLDGKHEDEWVDLLRDLAGHRERVENVRLRVRAWAERFNWRTMAEEYRAVYRAALA